MDALRHGQGRGALAPVNVLYISSYSKTLRRPIIYALFSQFFVNFSGLFSQTPLGLHPWTPLGTFVSRPPNLPTPGKNPTGAHAHI